MPLTTAHLLDLEHAGLWPDFHSKFINYCQEYLADALPREYEEPVRRFGSDVALLIRPGEASPFPRSESTTRDSGGVALLEPVTVPLAEIHEEVRQPFLEIIHRSDRSLVTVLELLSPSNKAEPGRARYLAKRRSLLESPVHLVELDLLQGGKRLSFGAPLPVGDFYCLDLSTRVAIQLPGLYRAIWRYFPSLACPAAGPGSRPESRLSGSV